MKFFVTGGSGFIGRALVRDLVARGHTLLILTRSESSSRLSEQVRYVRGSLGEITSISRQLSEFEPDAAIHLAWEGIPDFSVDMCLRNLRYGCDVFRTLASVGCRKIVGVGSWWEYGVQDGAVKEETPSIPTSPIAAIKIALRACGEQIAKENGITFVWVRPSFVYGPGQKDTSLIPYVINSIKTGVGPVIHNENVSNDFIYVDDVASALYALLEKDLPSDRPTYNIGSGGATHIMDVIRMVYESMGQESPFKEMEMCSASAMYADISKIAAEVGWRPQIPLKQGISRMIHERDTAV